MRTISVDWEEAGPTRTGLVLHVEVDKAGGSVGPGLPSLASRCSGRGFFNSESGLRNSRDSQNVWDSPEGSTHIECQGLREPAKYCLTTGSCGATGGWLEAGTRDRAAAWHSAKLFRF